MKPYDFCAERDQFHVNINSSLFHLVSLEFTLLESVEKVRDCDQAFLTFEQAGQQHIRVLQVTIPISELLKLLVPRC